jgi:hypothetical protein
MSKTLKDFLKEHDACSDGYIFAKDLTLEQFLNSCERGDWILWLFAKSNPDSLRELTLAKGHCANTVRHLMKDKRSISAVDAAIAFGEGKLDRKELYIASGNAAAAEYAYDYDAAEHAYAYAATAAAATAAATANAAEHAYAYAASASASASAYDYAANAAEHAYAYAATAAAAATAAPAATAACEKSNQKLTADICRKYLPIEIWNINKTNE